MDWGFLKEDSDNYLNDGLVFDHDMTFTCPASDSYTVGPNGNGKLTYPVGLLTGDEFMYAGGVYNTDSNTDSYLNVGVMSYTMTPGESYFVDGANNTDVLTFGPYLGIAQVNTEAYVRPVITVNSETLVTRGTGTSADPYIIYTE